MRRLLLPPLACLILAGCGPSAPPAFNARLAEYLTEHGDFGEATDKAPGGKIKMKLLPVDMTRKRIDAEVYHALPEELRAETPDDVGTLVKIYWKETPVSQGRTFYKVEALLVDAGTGKVIRTFGVQGGASKFRNRSGTRPVDLVVDTIKQFTSRQD